MIAYTITRLRGYFRIRSTGKTGGSLVIGNGGTTPVASGVAGIKAYCSVHDGSETPLFVLMSITTVSPCSFANPPKSGKPPPLPAFATTVIPYDEGPPGAGALGLVVITREGGAAATLPFPDKRPP